jgi:VCBS repeat-containing protein
MDRFNYTIGDSNGGFANATVYITVDGVNDDPMANDDAWIIDEDSVLNVVAPGVLTNDTDLDANDVLTVIAFDATSALGANVIVNAEGNFSYDPTGSFLLQSLALGEGRIDSFNYSVSDGQTQIQVMY